MTKKQSTLPDAVLDASFAEVAAMIQQSRSRAYQGVNAILVDLYWRIGAYISHKLETAAWGAGVVPQLAAYLKQKHPDLKGFTRPNLFRMRQFYETYRDDEIVSPLVRQLPWTHNLIIFSSCKRPEEREFYLRLAVQEHWDKRELERQIDGALFARAVLSPLQASKALKQMRPAAETIFKDAYLLEFLDLPQPHSEKDLENALLAHLRQFLIELGRDFCFIGEQYRLQVGDEDFFVDLLFYHRELQALVAFELKIRKFRPGDLGQLDFYLEALDRDVKKAHEQPSIGVLLCASKNDKVVEYALSRSLSPALVAEYQAQLPDKRFLQAKLHEFYQLAAGTPEETADDV